MALSRLSQGKAFQFFAPFCHLFQSAGDTDGLYFSTGQKPLPGTPSKREVKDETLNRGKIGKRRKGFSEFNSTRLEFTKKEVPCCPQVIFLPQIPWPQVKFILPNNNTNKHLRTIMNKAKY